jgi:CubicO group peptidase (beta-lactamase class C family)
MASAAEDLVNFAMSIHRGKLLRVETVERMFTSQTTRDGRPTNYGMGWGVGQIAGHPQFSHTGGQAGVSTVLRYLPNDKLAVAMMFNLEQVKFGPLADNIVQILLQ